MREIDEVVPEIKDNLLEDLKTDKFQWYGPFKNDEIDVYLIYSAKNKRFGQDYFGLVLEVSRYAINLWCHHNMNKIGTEKYNEIF